MSLPAGVGLLETGRVKYYSQRITKPPMADCMFAALCTPLSFMGYSLAEEFIRDLREASGIPTEDVFGNPQGTTTAHTKKALKKLLPDAEVLFGGLDDDDMLERIKAGEIVVRVMVDCEKLRENSPQSKARRFVRNFEGLHAVAVGGARVVDGEWQVRWMDPAGPRSGYSGRFVPYAEVRDSLKRTPSGKVRVTFGRKDSALPGASNTTSTNGNGRSVAINNEEVDPQIVTHGRIDERARIRKGTPFFHPRTGQQVTRASADDDFRLAGRSGDGRFAGVWVNTSKVPGASGLTLLFVDVDQIGEPFIGH